MAENRWDFGRCIRPILVVCLICICITVIIVRCDPEDDDCQLVIERGDVGIWLATSNEMATTSSSTYDRQGFVVQIGDFERSLHLYNGFSIVHSAGTKEIERDTTPANTVYWIDINAGTAAAIDSTHAWAMFPRGVSDWCQDAYDDADRPECIRTHMIHPYMETGLALITFWQGDGGWEVEADPSPDISNGFCFELPDAFSVTLWKADVTGSPPVFERVEEWAAGDVTSVTVHARDRPSDRGEVQAPPWIYP